MAIRRLVKVIRQKLIKFASDTVRRLIEPARNRPAICAASPSASETDHDNPPAISELLPTTESAAPPPPPGNINTTTSIVPAAANSSNHHDNTTSTGLCSSDDHKDDIINPIDVNTITNKRSSWNWEIIRPTYNRHWKATEAEILQDIKPLARLAKSIIHSGRYKDGERLTKKDEKAVIENLLKYHYGFDKKMGSGFDYIMVNRHAEFEDTRCMYVVRTDGSCMDFSYRKCLRGYVEQKYPAHAQKFILGNRHLVKY